MKQLHYVHEKMCTSYIICDVHMYIYIAGEQGVFIGKIVPSNPARAFLGYVNRKDSDKKIVTDVFEKGDSAFLSGLYLFS